jgi:ferredoxin
MAKIRIIYDKRICIGAAACVAMDPKYFEMVDGKAVLKGGKMLEKERYELVVDKNDESYHAAESCPVEAIIIEELQEKTESDKPADDPKPKDENAKD